MGQRKFLYILIAAWSVSGCAVAVNPLPAVNVPALMVAPAASRLVLGMTRTEVIALMKAPVTVGYVIDPVTQAAKPVQVQNLYSSEVLTLGADQYLVDHYLTHDVAAGVAVGENDLLPLVYQNNILVAKSREDLQALQKKYEK
ncbi:MAG: hypothetical protein HQL19_04750 [Candidatus Omnitrophica bacterium]|nr:hypothetical protein [Candidatus Omnitrophota bacterium]